MMYKKCILLVVALLISYLSMAQVEKANAWLPPQLRFSASANLYAPLKLDNHGAPVLHSAPLPTGEISLNYYQPIAKGFGLNIGAGITTAPSHLSFDTEWPAHAFDNEKPITLSIKDVFYGQWIWTFPISAQKIFADKNRDNLYYSVEIGGKANLLLNSAYESVIFAGYTASSGEDYYLFNASISDVGRKAAWSLFLKGGVVFKNRRENTFHLNLMVNYGLQEIGQGEYQFYDLPHESYGTITHNLHYVGFDFAYGLSLKKSHPQIAPEEAYEINPNHWLGRQIRLSVTPFYNQKAKIAQGDIVDIYSEPTFGYCVDLNYHQPFKSGWGLNAGLGFMRASMNLTFDHIIIYDEIYEVEVNMPDNFITVPIMAQKIFKSKAPYFFYNAELGAKLGFRLGEPVQEIVRLGDEYGNILFDSYSYTFSNIQATLMAKGGVIFRTKDLNTFHINAVVAYTPHYGYEGCAYLPYMETAPSGIFSQRFNYVGIELGYGFTFKKKR